MTWTLKYNDTLQIVEAAFSGITTGLEVRKATTRAIALLDERGVARALVDLSELESAPSIVDLYELPDRQYVEEGLSRRVRIALIESRSSNAREAAQFFETACVNRGWYVQLFASRDAAIEWLSGTDLSNMPDAGNGQGRA